MRISPRTGGDARPGHALAQHPTAFLHVANGTSTTGTIHDAGIPGESSIWADPLHDGPVPAGASDEELLEIRARHLAGEEHGVEANIGGLRRWRQIIDDHRAYDEIVLWYEHDLFDQLNLIQVLSRLAGPGIWPKPVSLICIGSFPGRPRFKGLGELTASELGPLFETRQPVTAAQYAVAVNAWAAFRAPEPTSIEAFLRTDTSALPYLAAALERHLEEFPSTADGLSRTEHRLLELAARGADHAARSLPADARRRNRVLRHRYHVARYCAGTVVSLHAAADAEGSWGVRPSGSRGATGTIELTDLGRAVLAGREDRIARCGIDRWLGGVHLSGTGPHWRWDRAHERVVRV